MNLRFKGEYKILTTFDWLNIPSLAIVSGLNGTGKSQLLELIYQSYQNKIHTKNAHIKLNYSLEIEGLNIVSKGAMLWKATGLTINLDNHKFGYPDLEFIVEYVNKAINDDKNGLTFLKKDAQNNRRELSRVKDLLDRKATRIIEEISTRTTKPLEKLTPEDISYIFPEEVLLEDFDLFSSDSLEMIFFMYLYKKTANEKYGLNLDIGEISPWDIVNRVIKESGLPYELTYPSQVLVDPIFKNALNRVTPERFQIQLIDSLTKKAIGFNNISSGERVILSLALLLYYSQNRKVKKNILLLDEPDAHLHPSLTKHLYDVIYNVLVKEYGCNVIISTHSPSTIALAPELPECKIYKLDKRPTKIIEVSERYDLISLLTDGLIIVSPITKYVIVEGKNDKPFYETIYKILLRSGKINKSPSLVFIPGTNLESVKHWVKELKEAGQNNVVGIIDRDKNNASTDRIYAINRYSIENYLLDPILLFVTTNRVFDELGDLNISRGDESEVIYYNNTQLQKIADVILNIISPKIIIKDASEDKVTINYLNGKSISIPKWFITGRGKNLLQIIQSELGGPSLISHKILLENIKRTKLIPTDLIELFAEIQKMK